MKTTKRQSIEFTEEFLNALRSAAMGVGVPVHGCIAVALRQGAHLVLKEWQAGRVVGTVPEAEDAESSTGKDSASAQNGVTPSAVANEQVVGISGKTDPDISPRVAEVVQRGAGVAKHAKGVARSSKGNKNGGKRSDEKAG